MLTTVIMMLGVGFFIQISTHLLWKKRDTMGYHRKGWKTFPRISYGPTKCLIFYPLLVASMFHVAIKVKSTEGL